MTAPPDGTKLARIAAVQSSTVALVEQSGAVVTCCGEDRPGSAVTKALDAYYQPNCNENSSLIWYSKCSCW